MGSIKVVLVKHKMRQDGTMPIAVRLINNRKVSYIYLGQYITQEMWDAAEKCVRKPHPNRLRINMLIAETVALANEKMLEMNSADPKTSAKVIKKKIKNANSTVSFFSIAHERYQNNIKNEKFSVANSDLSRVKNFKAFLNNDDITINQIDFSMLQKFKVYLHSVKNQSPRSIQNHLLLIRTIYNSAIKEKLIDNSNYPFGKGKISIKLPESLKIGLTESEVKSISALHLEIGSGVFHARNKWLFSFYFAGMRISDVLTTKWSDFLDDRLLYRMGKNKKVVSIKVPKQLAEVLKYYEHDKKSDTDYIFPDLKSANKKDKEDLYRKLNTATKNTNNHLDTLAKMAKITKNLTNHIARHTFGNIAGDQISPQMLQKLYRHSDIRTTMAYQANFIHKSADEALDAVINF